MRTKPEDLRFYEMLRDYLQVYLVIQRKFSEATVKNYTDSLKQFRLYLREQRSILFDKAGFNCFSKEIIYDFCIWLRDDQKRSVNTVNLRLSAIVSFLSYCAEKDIALTELYIKARSIHRFKGRSDPGLEYLDQKQLEIFFSHPDIRTKTEDGTDIS